MAAISDIFKCIFFNENVWIANKISLIFLPKYPIDNIPALVQIMAWCQPDTKSLSEPTMVGWHQAIIWTNDGWLAWYQAIIWTNDGWLAPSHYLNQWWLVGTKPLSEPTMVGWHQAIIWTNDDCRGIFGSHSLNELWESMFKLTHCGLMTSYGNRDLGQYWLR